MTQDSNRSPPEPSRHALMRHGPPQRPAGDPPEDPTAPSQAAPTGAPEPPAQPTRAAFATWQVVGALLIAGASDLIGGSLDSTIAGVPATIPLDILTALALWAMLGRPALLLVALIAEALPITGVLPLWTAVVIAIAMTGGIPGRTSR